MQAIRMAFHSPERGRQKGIIRWESDLPGARGSPL